MALLVILLQSPAVIDGSKEKQFFHFRPKAQEQIYYLDSSGQDWVWLQDSINYDSPLRVRFDGADSIVPSPNKFGLVASIAARNHAIWACVILAEDDDDKAKMILLRWDLLSENTDWERVAEINSDNGVPTLVVPLDADGMFLAVSQPSVVSFLDEQKGASLAAIYRLRHESLEFVRCVEIPFDSLPSIATKSDQPALLIDDAEPSSQRPSIFETASTKLVSDALAPYLWPPSISNKYLALCGSAAGCIWVFELEKGSLYRTFYLDKLSLEDLDKIDILNPLILGTAFGPDGRLIVAKRDPELVKIALQMAHNKKFANDKRSLAQELVFFKDNLNQIIWLSIDIESKSIEDYDGFLDTPSEPSRLKNPASLNFLISPDGKAITNMHLDWGAAKSGVDALKPAAPVGAKEAGDS
jgi:hypothetical protein